MALILLLFIFLLILELQLYFFRSKIIYLVVYDVPLALVAQKIYGGLDKFTIMAIPFFILTG